MADRDWRKVKDQERYNLSLGRPPQLEDKALEELWTETGKTDCKKRNCPRNSLSQPACAIRYFLSMLLPMQPKSHFEL